MEEQKKCLPELVRIARKTNTPIVATNDVHFLRKEDHDMHDVLICIGTNENWLPQNACAIPRKCI